MQESGLISQGWGLRPCGDRPQLHWGGAPEVSGASGWVRCIGEQVGDVDGSGKWACLLQGRTGQWLVESFIANGWEFHILFKEHLGAIISF